MIQNLGWVATNSTIRIPWHSFDSSGASATTTGLAAADVEVYKNGSTTQRASDNGYTVTTDFDGATGCHLVTIDLSDNSDSGFYAEGSEYLVMVNEVTIDGQTVRFWLARFMIGVEPADVTRISGDSGAADNFETMLDGTGGQTLSLKQLNVVNTTGDAIVATSSGSNGRGMVLTGNGTGSGLQAVGGGSAHGIVGQGGASDGAGIRGEGGGGGAGISGFGGSGGGHGMSLLGGSGISGGDGLYVFGGSSNGVGFRATGVGTGSGFRAVAGATGNGVTAVGGSTSGHGLSCTVTSGTELDADLGGLTTGAIDAILDRTAGVETNLTVRQALRLMAAVLLGKSTVSGSTVTFRDTNDSKDRVTATASGGARSAVTKDAT